ncbi:DUF2306 domain-containing protein [Bradyrhizobium sp. 197]|jgi:uncharacterized membrane protein|uniref:DUF2306 domain-containing protein n=1 Tax=Bradyrhizobium sp. 197 TaxID=2782663 RepID=UPI001FF9E490|nr:DUF2306 domain-containing protein [Bradyrhizobium sp. 197]MCK1474471.1 DUF2306 domain-containing protein [Bradyrhizobium sp. 197]
MIAHSTVAATIHVTLALLCAVVGFIQFVRPKRGAGHRARGYFYVYAMLVSDVATLLVYRFTGHFTMFHVAAIVNFTCIVLAVVPLLRTPRPSNWLTAHYYFIAWSYPSLMSAGLINMAARLLPLTTRGQVELTALLVSIATMTIAYVLIRKNRPASDQLTGAAMPAGQSGVQT